MGKGNALLEIGLISTLQVCCENHKELFLTENGKSLRGWDRVDGTGILAV